MRKTTGTKYCPSNGTEGEIFKSYFCDDCARESFNGDTGEGDQCEIMNRAICHDIDDDEYPEEWTFDNNGQPTCTAFVVNGTEIQYRCENTNDMFDGI